MSGLRLKLRQAPQLRVDLASLDPAALAGCDAASVAKRNLQHGTERIAIGEFFAVSSFAGNDDLPELVFEGDLSRFDRIGAGMSGGRLHVEGNAGDYLACGMTNGWLRVDGDAGDFTAAALAGGNVLVAGDTGDFAAAALPGDMDGMRGGLLEIGGNAGERFGDRMRRGTALVVGDVGAFAASRLVAGTIAIGGRVGPQPCYGMRRGSFVTLDTSLEPAPHTFTQTGSGFEVFWHLLSMQLAQAHACFASLPQRTPVRFVGDLAVDGKGEILLA